MCSCAQFIDPYISGGIVQRPVEDDQVWLSLAEYAVRFVDVGCHGDVVSIDRQHCFEQSSKVVIFFDHQNVPTAQILHYAPPVRPTLTNSVAPNRLIRTMLEVVQHREGGYGRLSGAT
jgi:hypothetical protein